jgi:methionyl-tRNA formyltransferase
MTKFEATKARIVFFGTDAFSVPSLIQLLANHWQVVGVVTKPDSAAGRGRAISAPAVKRLATAKNIPVFQPAKLADIELDLMKLKADAGIVVAYGKIIPATMLELFPLKLINVHASLLPLYRGASPIEAAILNGDNETGITLMQLEPGLDTGPTYDFAKIQLGGQENREDLYARLADLGADILIAKLHDILEGRIVPIPQNEAEASTVGRISKSDGFIDWAKPAQVIEREIRAYFGWPGSRTQIAGTDTIITAAHTQHASGPSSTAFKSESGDLAVYAGTGSLVIDRLKPAGKREMSGSDFLSGHKV